ncbi:MAG: sugar ABC transporter permease [Sphaerochaetaceae bacterium]|nr:sugar ABC transporter permease [Sphaerochaetaceae bacterium]MDC7237084.1 sugar ABC transporter permease [Sphaerochaetaceae bacterium]MDC7250147.1 sugar ABC transporter permease [Sphaerochaetaceae bacterium]
MAVRKLTLQEKDSRLGIKLVLPSVIIIALLIIYPIFYNIYLSFFDVKMNGDAFFIGLKNYANVLTDSTFWSSVGITFFFVISTTFLTTVMGLVVALVMNKKFPLRGLVRSLVLLPYVAPVISTVYSWQFFFDPVNGIFMHVLVDVLHISQSRFNLISDPKYALWVAVVFSMWKAFPFTYLMILSRLQTIDTTLYEAAEIDGAGAIRKFWSITLPELFFVLGSIVLLRFIWNFNKFEEVYLLTDNVKVLSVYTYFKAFTGSLDLGQGSALVVIQFSLLVGLILIYVKKVLKW